MSAITEYTHLIPSLKVYPRVYFFSNRYRDVLDNFKTFAGRNQKILSESEIEVPRNDFENGLEVKVIGKEDLDPSAFVAAEPLLYERQLCTTSASEKEYHTDCIVPVNPLKYDVRSSSDSRKGDKKSNTGENQFKTPEITLFICYATVENLNNEGLKQIKLLLNRVPERKDALLQGCFLLCRSRNKFTQSEKNAFQEKIKTCFGGSGVSQVIIGTSNVDIKNEISLYLEGRLVEYFLTIQSILQQYTTSQKGNYSRKPLLETDTVVKQIKGFLENGLGLTDLEPISEKDKGYLDTVVCRLSLIVKCALVHPLSEKYNMPIWLCNHILMGNDFEQKIYHKVSRNTKYHLRKLENFAKECRKLSTEGEVVIQPESFRFKSFHLILYGLQKDLADIVTDMEQVFDQLTKEVRTLLFEISCYLKKSKVDVGQNEELARRYSSAADTDLRKEILGIKGVYGAGTIYGQFEVHVDSDADIPLVEAEMCRMMRQKNHFRQYIVRSVERKTKPFALCHGKEMVCQPRMGTLGGFVDGVDGSNRHLYGLTCAHVVNGQGEGRYEVFIREESNNQLLLFARSYPNLTISSGDVPNPLIDLAAVRVVDGVKNECIKYLKDENSEFKPGRVAADVDLEGHFVYKYGAKTHFTKGRVCSTDYCLNNNLNYIVLVENYGGIGYFAQEGDSGAMICMPDENEVYIVKAIGILTGGNLELSTDARAKYVSFRLHDGLDKLTGKAGGIQFTFPNNFM